MSRYLYKGEVKEICDTALFVASLDGRVNLSDYVELDDLPDSKISSENTSATRSQTSSPDILSGPSATL